MRPCSLFLVSTSMLFPHVMEEEGYLSEAPFIRAVIPLNKLGFPGGSDGKESACSAGDPGLVPGSGGSPGEGSGHPLRYSCREDSMDRGAWWATVHRITEHETQLSN